MDNDHGYLYQLLGLSWDAIEGGAFVIDLIIAFAVVVIIRSLERRNKMPAIWPTIKKHPLLEDDKVRMLAASLLIFCIQFIFISPHTLFVKNRATILDLEQKINDRSPKLTGFIDRSFIADEPGTSNSLIFLETTIGNSGGSPSSADYFGLFLVTTNATNAIGEIYFTNDYTLNFIHDGKPYLLDLKRSELLSEKTHKAIQRGDSPRGWMAFRFNGMPLAKYSPTNLVLCFLDIDDKKTRVTNIASYSQALGSKQQDALSMIFPGSDNIFYLVQQEMRTNWLPPELPPGCTNVIVYFGSQPIGFTRQELDLLDATNGQEFAIKDLPSAFLKNLDTLPDYSPRKRDVPLRLFLNVTIGGKTFPYPIQPVIINNRLFIEVEIPFSNEKQKLVMDDAFNSDLSQLPRLWDWNFSTNYDQYGNGYYYYEIVNELTNPVLQVAYAAPNVIFVNGIFKVDQNSIYAAFNQPPALLEFSNYLSENLQTTKRITTMSRESQTFKEVLLIETNDTAAEIGEMWTNEFYRPVFQYQHRIFNYPSSLHLGEMNSLVDTNKSGTKTAGNPE